MIYICLLQGNFRITYFSFFDDPPTFLKNYGAYGLHPVVLIISVPVIHFITNRVRAFFSPPARPPV